MSYPKNCLITAPTGVWIFVGSVAGELAYVTKDGQTPTQEQMDGAAQCGPGIVGLKSRSWPTQAAAEAEAKRLGQEVTYPTQRQES